MNDPVPSVQSQASRVQRPIRIGDLVRPSDRKNVGKVIAKNDTTSLVHFVSEEGTTADKSFPDSELAIIENHETATDARKQKPLTLTVDELAAAERQVIGSALHDPATLDTVSELRGEHFLDTNLGQFFDAIGILRETGFDLRDLTVLVSELRRMGVPDDVIAPHFLARLIEQSFPRNVEWYGQVIRDAAKRRKIKSICTDTAAATENGHATTDILSQLFVTVHELTTDKMAPRIPAPVPANELIKQNPQQKEPVIGGLLRRGEYGNFNATPKLGKSIAVTNLAFSTASGSPWFGAFPCEKGRVLLFDNELPQPTIEHRLRKISQAMGLSEYLDMIDVVSLRGTGTDLFGLQRIIDPIKPGHYRLAIFDAWYRLVPRGFNEGLNADLIALYNVVELYAQQLDAAVLLVHHQSKGPQHDKQVTDLGSGGGVQSRAPDLHAAIRPHEEDGIFVFEAVVRSFPPVEPISLRYEWPVWQLVDADPRRLKRPRSDREQRREAEDKEAINKIYSLLFEHKKATEKFLRGETGFNRDRLQRLLAKMKHDGQIIFEPVKIRGNDCFEYQLAPPKD